MRDDLVSHQELWNLLLLAWLSETEELEMKKLYHPLSNRHRFFKSYKHDVPVRVLVMQSDRKLMDFFPLVNYYFPAQSHNIDY